MSPALSTDVFEMRMLTERRMQLLVEHCDLNQSANEMWIEYKTILGVYVASMSKCDDLTIFVQKNILGSSTVYLNYINYTN